METAELDLFSHQEDCIDNLNKEYIKNSRKRGMISIPTGGGKTTITSVWLLNTYLKKGYRVLWLTHRVELLKQAQNTFKELSDINNKILNNMILISAENSSWSEVKATDKIVFSTDQSAIRSLQYLQLMINQSDKGIITVIDEAHHTASNTYRKIVNNLFNTAKNMNKDLRLLGLTATPYRMNPEENQTLWKIYDDQYNISNLKLKKEKKTGFESIIFDVSQLKLISKGILATPNSFTIKTNIHFEFKKLVAKSIFFNDINPKLLAMIGKNNLRNEKIVENYKNNKEKYGKTIVFATDINHCRLLTNEFKKQKIDADYIGYNLSPEKNNNIINSFRENKSPKVLINVLKLTEGFDAPETKTIFLTRPTGSESLLRQMIGRGMRGPSIGGTETVNLVTFVDTWKLFNPIVFDKVIEQDDQVARIIPVMVGEDNDEERINDELLARAYNIIKNKADIRVTNTFDSIPHSWFYWEKPLEYDDSGNVIEEQDKYIIVFQNQYHHYKNLINYIENNIEKIPEKLEYTTVLDINHEYFRNCQDPLPSDSDIKDLIEAIKNNNIEVKHCLFESKNKFNPTKLAQEFINKSMGLIEINEKIQEIYRNNEVCQSVYNTISKFNSDVFSEIKRLSNRNIDIKSKIDIPESNLKKLSDWESYSNVPFNNLNLIAKTIIYNDKVKNLDVSQDDYHNFVWDKVKTDLSKIKSDKINEQIINQIIEYNDINDSTFKDALFLYELYKLYQNEKDDGTVDNYLFPDGKPEYKEIRFTEEEVKYFGTFRESDQTIIINGILNSPDIPLFVIEYIVYKQLVKADMHEIFMRSRFNDRLKDFVPTINARTRAFLDGYHEEGVDNYWYAVSTQFSDSLHRIYDI